MILGRRSSRLLVACAAVTGVTAGPGAASANGRFPAAYQLVVDPTDEARVAVQVTYGFLTTFDAGASWGWVCEDAAGYGGDYDPPVQLLAGGTLIAGVFDGLVVGTPDACSFGFVGGALEGRYVKDVSALKSDATHALAVTSDGLGMNQFDSRVWKTLDGAASFAQLGAQLPADFLPLTLDAAPSDEARVYVSGFRVIDGSNYEGVLARSSDDGATWEVITIPGTNNQRGPYIGAIDPSDPDVLWVRLGGDGAALLRSTDAGDTWETAFEVTGRLEAFALSPDGSEVLAGGKADGLHRASTSDLAFTQIFEHDALCATWTNGAIYVCSAEARAGFTIGKSTDDGATFAPFHHLSCLDGPVPSCGATTAVKAECAGPWAAQKQLLQTDTCESGAGGGGAGGGTTTDDGGGGADEGCCTVAPGGAARRGGQAAVALVAALALGWARRRAARRPA